MVIELFHFRGLETLEIAKEKEEEEEDEGEKMKERKKERKTTSKGNCEKGKRIVLQTILL